MWLSEIYVLNTISLFCVNKATSVVGSQALHHSSLHNLVCIFGKEQKYSEVVML